MNQREIWALVGMGTGSALCRQIRHLRQRQPDDAGLRDHMESLQNTLEMNGQ